MLMVVNTSTIVMMNSAVMRMRMMVVTGRMVSTRSSMIMVVMVLLLVMDTMVLLIIRWRVVARNGRSIRIHVRGVASTCRRRRHWKMNDAATPILIVRRHGGLRLFSRFSQCQNRRLRFEVN